MFETYRNLFDLTGNVALVAGGTGGIGEAVCHGLAALGATVIVAGRASDKAEQVVRSIEASGGSAWAGRLDVLDVAHTNSFVTQIAERHGRLDVLVNCAGTLVEAPAIDYREEDWDKVLDLNLKAAFFLSQAVARVQIPRGGGKHIHISSVRSLLGLRRGYVAYCASKGGLSLLIKQLATEWAKHQITVNGIAPTFTRTELVRKMLEDPSFYEPLLARIPLGRLCEPQDVAALAAYFAMPASDFITGQTVYLDGGVTATQ